MPAVLDIRSVLQQHRQAKAGDVQELARRLGKGETVDPEEVIRATTSAGIDDDTFLGFVDMVRRREELRQTAAGMKAHELELAGVRAAMAKHRVTLDEAQARYRAAIVPRARLEEDAQARTIQAQAARSALTSPANTPEFLIVAIESARSALLKASTAVAEKTRAMEKEQKRSDEARQELDKHYGGAERALDAFENANARRDYPAEWSRLCEQAKYGAHRAGVAGEELVELVTARDAAEKVFNEAEKTAFDY
jgi:hypothetical protein